jgi:hypothetical protein
MLANIATHPLFAIFCYCETHNSRSRLTLLSVGTETLIKTPRVYFRPTLHSQLSSPPFLFTYNTFTRISDFEKMPHPLLTFLFLPITRLIPRAVDRRDGPPCLVNCSKLCDQGFVSLSICELLQYARYHVGIHQQARS